MVSFDLRETLIPFSLLEITNLFREMKPGEELEILAGTDPTGSSILKDVLLILPRANYDLISKETIANDSSVTRLMLRKKNSNANPNERKSIMTEIDLNAVAVSSTVDARGSACPGPLLEAKKGIGKVKVGEILEIYSNDSGTRTDIPAWAKKVGHDYLGILEADGYDKHFVCRKK
jgi:tRNA 2-thiouridine synthesizing protein A